MLVVIVLSVLPLWYFIRRRHRWDYPIIILLVLLSIAAGLGIYFSTKAIGLVVAVMICAIVFDFIPLLPITESMMAQIRGNYKWAARFNLLGLIIQPTGANWLAYRMMKILNRFKEKALSLEEAVSQIDSMELSLNRFSWSSLARVHSWFGVPDLMLGAIEGERNDLVEHCNYEYFIEPQRPVSIAHEMYVRALCETDRFYLAFEVIDKMMQAVGPGDVMAEAYRNRTFLYFIAFCGCSVQVDGLLSRKSNLRILFSRQERKEIIKLSMQNRWRNSELGFRDTLDRIINTLLQHSTTVRLNFYERGKKQRISLA